MLTTMRLFVLSFLLSCLGMQAIPQEIAYLGAGVTGALASGLVVNALDQEGFTFSDISKNKLKTAAVSGAAGVGGYLLFKYLTPATQEKSYACAGLMGTLVGGVIGRVCSSHRSHKASWSMSGIGGAVGAAGGYLGYLFTNQFTPIGRIIRAETALENVKNCCCAQKKCDTEKQLSKMVHDNYGLHSWPLVAAFHDFMHYIGVSKQSIRLAQAARKEDSSFKERAEAVESEAKGCCDNIDAVVQMLRNDKNFSVQFGQFQKERHHKESLHVQKSGVNAQWTNVYLQSRARY